MKRSLFLLGGITLGMLTSIVRAMDETAPLVTTCSDISFELISIEENNTILTAHNNGLRTNKEGHLVYIHKNLSSCAGLETLKTQLHLNTVTYLNLSNNKLQEVPTEIFTTMPNLVTCDLSHNRITKMCDPIPEHKNLKALSLHHNAFTRFTLEDLLEAIPLKQLTLHENKIETYGILRSDCPSLEELWIDNAAQKWMISMVASRCTNLVAEMCEGDTTVQDMNTKIEYSAECRAQCTYDKGMKNAFYTGVGTGALIGMGTVITCLFALPRHTIAVEMTLTFTTPLVGGLTGLLSKFLYRIYCNLKPEERITKTILKQIAQYPPSIKGTE